MSKVDRGSTPETLERTSSEYRTLGHQWADSTVTWSFADFVIVGDPRQAHIGSTFLVDDSDGMRSLIRDAFNAWEAVCGIDFVEVTDSAASDIRIGWTSAAESDGPGGTLAYWQAWTWLGTSTTKDGVIAIDRADSGVSHSDIYDTVLHEVGHALGLDHSNIRNVVMSGGLGTEPGGLTPYWGGVPGRDPLQPDDIAGAVALWGAPTGGVGGPTTPPPPPPPRGPTSGDDTLFGTQGPDSIDGGTGNDIIYGLRGNDTLRGGAGNDTLDGGFNLERDGAHESTGGRNVLEGGSGDDHMSAGSAGIGDRTWTPAPGSDTFVFAPRHGHDTVYGNWGTTAGREFYGAPEKVDLSAYGDRAPTWDEVSENLRSVSAPNEFGTYAPSARLDLSDFGGGSITFWNTNIRYIDASDFIGLSTVVETGPEGTPGADTLNGGAGPDSLAGLGGPDILLGGGGADTLRGGDGADRMWGEAGHDSLDGGPGEDLIFGQSGQDRIRGGEGGDIILAGTGNDSVEGNGGDDRVWGQEGSDTLTGGTGADFLAGGSGEDSLDGGAGAGDYVWGEGGRDTVSGGTGYDILVGGSGSDRLVGGSEGDTFFGHGSQETDVWSDTFVVSGGLSWLMDFQPGTDRIALSGTTEADLRAGAQQQGHHLLLTGAGGEQIYLAWTTLSELDGADLML